jgi:hypothetical protein
MAFNTGVTRYQKKKWMDAIAALSTLKIALYSTTTGLDANQDPASPLAYTATGELASSGTGYTTGGYAVASASVTASGNSYQLDFTDLSIGSGTIASGTYGAMIYDTADSNRVMAVLQVNVTVGSSGTTMTITVPTGVIAIG